ncbi:MAG: aconitate hydratase AcnA [Betaproteobacteria bacterium]
MSGIDATVTEWGSLEVAGGRARYCKIAAALAAHGGQVDVMPFCLRVLTENIARNLDATGADGNTALAALARWPASAAVALPLFVTRVILPDSSGLPVLLDLAALRNAVAEAGGDPTWVTPRVPVDLIIDHSLQVDHAGTPNAMVLNLQREFARNDERYRFVKWAQSALGGVRVFPPGTGIIHQVNLEHLATVVTQRDTPQGPLLMPDFVIGGDSHTPMVNGLGVLGWGVGGLDAEAILLGRPNTIALPRVLGVRLVGRMQAGATTTDLALLVTQRLRAHGVTGDFVEFFGPAAAALAVPERATLANMAPEYGATMGFFPVDTKTLDYLRATGRTDAHVERVDRYCRANHLFRDADASVPVYSDEVVIDIGDAVPTLAGPRRPQDRLPLPDVVQDFRTRLQLPSEAGGFGINGPVCVDDKAHQQFGHGSIVVAAITSCTNTSNPAVMVAAGLLARNAVARGMRPPSWVKTSMAPGSQVVTRYLAAAGLLAPLEALGFHVIGYGCTTCGGKSGPLDADVAATIEREGLVVATVLSGNRNFEGRIHRLARANYIGSPPLVVAFALAGRIDIDVTRDPIGVDANGNAVMLADLWPDADELAQAIAATADPSLYRDVYANAETGPELWRQLSAPTSECFAWNPTSTYLVKPPFVVGRVGDDALPERVVAARVLVAFGDSLTTDHISPSGEIPAASAAGEYLQSLGIAPKNFNSYVGRRCNHEVMLRGTFANVRIRNLLVPGIEGGMTRTFPGDVMMRVHEAARQYLAQGTPLLVLGGRDYGSGSSRDWAAKGTAMLGVRAVLAQSFERIHRANLVSMGVLPLRFATESGWRALGLSGTESFTLEGVRAGVLTGTPIAVTATGDAGSIHFVVTADVHTDDERRILLAGGMLPAVLQSIEAPVNEATP